MGDAARDNRRARQGRTAPGTAGGLGVRLRATVTLAAMLVFGLSVKLSMVLGAVLIQGDTFWNAIFSTGASSIGLLLFWGGILVILIVGMLGFLGHIHAPPRETAYGILVAVIVIAIGGAMIASSAGNIGVHSNQIATNQEQLQGYISTPSETGCSLNTVSWTVTCDVVYNYTSNYFAVEASNASTYKKPTYIDVTIHEARVDKVNSTYGFIAQVASIPTVTTTDATYPTMSPVVGFVPATGTASGYWLVKQNAGSLSGLNPSESAPSVTSDLGSSTIGIAAFGSVADTFNITLPGTGGSPAPSALYTALASYGSYSMTFTVQDATPFTYTLTVVDIGEFA